MKKDKKYRIVFVDDENYMNCDYCGKYGHFNANNFEENGLCGFIGFTMDDFIELDLTHLNNDSIRCEKCLKIK